MDRVRMFLDRLPFREWRIVRYVISGGTSAVTNLALLFVFTHVFGIWYIYSSILSVSVATIVSFVLQKLWTFRNFHIDRVHVQFPLHITLALVNIALNTGILYALVEWAHVWYLLAQVIAGALLACVNYTVYKTVIFHEIPASTPVV